jgi:cytochrome c peroxidase
MNRAILTTHRPTARRATRTLGQLLGLVVGAAVLLLAGCAGSADNGAPPSADGDHALTRRARLGKQLFNDATLSTPAGMSCATCHNPAKAFGGNNGSTNGVAVGNVAGVQGTRTTPSLMYGSFAPAFAMVPGDDGPTPTGGQFLDGRVDTQAQQALQPLLAATEMNNPDGATVAHSVSLASYAADFQAEFGADIFARPADAFAAVGAALQAYEHSAEFHPFSSRFDDYVRGHDTFTPSQRRGMRLFFDPSKGNCVGCHAADLTSSDPAASLFTDFTYDNLGVPRNAGIPANSDTTFFDYGLGGPKRTLPGGDTTLNGAFKVPTLRNVAVKEAFFHNGRFTTLQETIEFYATRDTDPTRWYGSGPKFNDLDAAFRGNVNTAEVPYDRHPGEAPHLDATEIHDLIAFIQTLTDDAFVGLLPPPQSNN